MPWEMPVTTTASLGRILTIAMAIAASSSLAQPAHVADNERDTAFALEQQGRNGEAETAWRAVLSSHPSDAEAYAHLGFLEARQQKYKEAVPLYRKALALDPGMPGLPLNLGLSLFKSGSLRESIQIFTPLLKDQPLNSPEALRLRSLIGIARYGLGDFAAAVPYLKEAASSDPQNLSFRLFLAHSCLASDQYQCVLDVYHEILLLNAESAEADMLAGEAMDELKDHDGAIQEFRAAIKANPNEPAVHFGLGYLLWTQSKYEEAAKEFQAELAIVPNHAQSMAFLADSDMQTGHAEEARPLLEKAISIDPAVERAQS
jgi:tetratricopeptide (TPR) repeat protein